MTTNATKTEWTRRRYNRIVAGFYAVGIGGFFLGMFLGYDLVGAVVYLLGVIGGIGSSVYARRLSPVTMTDERDERFVQRASYLTMMIVAAFTLAVFPVLFVFDAAGTFTFSPLLTGVLYTVGAIGLLFLASCLAIKYVL